MSFAQGRKSEQEFKLFLESKDFDVRDSTREENINDHIDFFVKKKGTDLETSVDIKGLKKVSRRDSNANEDFHWVEIKNVNGDKGWAYSSVDSFAFETLDYWVIVRKEKLQDLIKEKVEKSYVTKSSDALYRLYKREGRKDVITMAKTMDLMAIAHRIFKK